MKKLKLYLKSKIPKNHAIRRIYRFIRSKYKSCFFRNADSLSYNSKDFKLLDSLIANRVYEKETYDLAKYLLFCSESVVYKFRAYDYFIQVYGFNNKYTGYFVGFCISNLSLLSNRQKLRILPLLINDNISVADKVVSDLGVPYIEKTAPYISICKYINNKTKDIHPKIYNGAVLYDEILRNNDSLINLLKDKSKTLCIVGNSPSEIGKRNGSLIDSFDIVIRFNNYCLKNKDDYGSKETIWIKVPNKEVDLRVRNNNDFIVFAANNILEKKHNAIDFFSNDFWRSCNICTVKQEIYNEAISNLGCLPSTGFLTIMLVSKFRSLTSDNLFGFSHLYDDIDFHDHYFLDSKVRNIHTHSWSKERELIKGLLIK